MLAYRYTSLEMRAGADEVWAVGSASRLGLSASIATTVIAGQTVAAYGAPTPRPRGQLGIVASHTLGRWVTVHLPLGAHFGWASRTEAFAVRTTLLAVALRSLRGARPLRRVRRAGHGRTVGAGDRVGWVTEATDCDDSDPDVLPGSGCSCDGAALVDGVTADELQRAVEEAGRDTVYLCPGAHAVSLDLTGLDHVRLAAWNADAATTRLVPAAASAFLVWNADRGAEGHVELVDLTLSGAEVALAVHVGTVAPRAGGVRGEPGGGDALREPLVRGRCPRSGDAPRDPGQRLSGQRRHRRGAALYVLALGGDLDARIERTHFGGNVGGGGAAIWASGPDDNHPGDLNGITGVGVASFRCRVGDGSDTPCRPLSPVVDQEQ